jgi:GNAT superfamily N-acetyltransferase
MNTEAVRIEQVKVKDLYSFALNYSANKSKGDIEVITPHRAYAHTKNPFANDDDIGLMLAYKNGKCIGYQGLMPGIVRIRDINERIIWPTTIYISPEARGQSISTLLIKTALLLNKPLIVTGMSNMSEPVLQHLKFKPLRKVEFSEINFRRLRIMPIRITEKILRKVLFPLYKKGTDREFSDGSIYKLLKKWTYKIIEKKFKSDYENIICEEIPSLDESFKSKIVLAENSFPRPLEWINWMLQYKWVLGKDEADQSESNYYFSNTRDYFQYVTLKLLSSGTEKKDGFLIFSISKDKGNVRIKLLDHTFENKEDGRHIAAIILKYAKSMLTDSIEISSDVVQYFNLGIFNKILFVQREWRYLYSMSDISNQIVKDIEKTITNYCDGDIAFV